MIETSFPLTICTVSFESKRFLELNWELTTYLNRGIDLTWLVAENSPELSCDALRIEDPNFTVIPGAKYEIKIHGSASFHHAAGMNKLLSQVRTRFVLFLDPDFYIIRSSWIQEILNYMQVRNLSFFGAPWHPKRYVKDRYFPCVHCLFIDLNKVPLDTLDFTPRYDTVPAYTLPRTAVCPSNSSMAKGQIGILPKILRRLSNTRIIMKLQKLLDLENRKLIGSSNDVSYLISKRYKDNPVHKSECLIPFFKYNQTVSNAIVEKLLPDHLCYVPKRNEYFTTKGFKDFGFPDLNAYNWEEFFWATQPFGFHVRSYPKRTKNESSFEDIFEHLNFVLKSYVFDS